MLEAARKEEGEVGKISYTLLRGLHVWMEDGPEDIAVNDWLALHEHGEISVYDPEYFVDHFEPVEVEG